jgi:hypothetical protein
VKITVRCGVSDRGKPCGRELGAKIQREGFPGPQWFRDGDYERLRWEERHRTCPKHGAVQVREEDLLRLALNPEPPVIMAKLVRARRA